MNHADVMGRLTRDPEVRVTAQGTTVARYTLAVNGRNRTDYIPISAFGKSGEFAGKYFKKGMMVAVSGRINIDSFVGNDGTNKSFTSIVAEDQYFCESKKKEDKEEEFMPDESTEDTPF